MDILPPQPDRFYLPPARYQQAGLFLDRDGIVNIEMGHHVWQPEQFDINESVVSLLRQAQVMKLKCIIVTNQSGIAQGKYTHGHVRKLHRIMLDFFRGQGIRIDAIYYSPHHESYGLSLSRKPGSLMLERGLARYRIHNSKAWMLGDKDRDIEAAQRIGVGGIQVPPNSDLQVVADFLKQEFGRP